MNELVEKEKNMGYIFNFPPVADSARTYRALMKDAAYLTEQAGELVASFSDGMSNYDIIALTMSVIHRAENIFVGLYDTYGSGVYEMMDDAKRDVITIWQNRGEYGDKEE